MLNIRLSETTMTNMLLLQVSNQMRYKEFAFEVSVEGVTAGHIRDFHQFTLIYEGDKLVVETALCGPRTVDWYSMGYLLDMFYVVHGLLVHVLLVVSTGIGSELMHPPFSIRVYNLTANQPCNVNDWSQTIKQDERIFFTSDLPARSRFSKRTYTSNLASMKVIDGI